MYLVDFLFSTFIPRIPLLTLFLIRPVHPNFGLTGRPVSPMRPTDGHLMTLPAIIESLYFRG